MNFSIEQLRWGVRRRLEFIEFRLLWDGRLNRRDLTETFGISAQQASADIALYSQIARDSLVYDRANKMYMCTDVFDPIFLSRSIDRHLLQLVAITNQWMRQEDSWFSDLPPVEIVSLDSKPTDSTVLLNVLQAIRSKREIDIEYSSLTGTSQPNRTIAPHALTYNNGQWYIRSWSARHNDFRDYSLNRIDKVTGFRPTTVDPLLDFEWIHEINLVIVPNPNLSQEKKAAVAHSFKMTDGKLEYPCRLSVSFYLISQYKLDLDPTVLDPEKQQVILLNLDEVENARSATRQMSKEALVRAVEKDDLAR